MKERVQSLSSRVKVKRENKIEEVAFGNSLPRKPSRKKGGERKCGLHRITDLPFLSLKEGEGKG